MFQLRERERERFRKFSGGQRRCFLLVPLFLEQLLPYIGQIGIGKVLERDPLCRKTTVNFCAECFSAVRKKKHTPTAPLGTGVFDTKHLARKVLPVFLVHSLTHSLSLNCCSKNRWKDSCMSRGLRHLLLRKMMELADFNTRAGLQKAALIPTYCQIKISMLTNPGCSGGCTSFGVTARSLGFHFPQGKHLAASGGGVTVLAP